MEEITVDNPVNWRINQSLILWTLHMKLLSKEVYPQLTGLTTTTIGSPPRNHHWQATITSNSLFDGTFPKYKLFRDKILAVAAFQQMARLFTPHYKTKRHRELLQSHRSANMFIESELLCSKAGLHLTTWRHTMIVKMVFFRISEFLLIVWITGE